MKTPSIKSTLFRFAALCIGITAYVLFMGLSADRAAAVTVYEFSKSALNNWRHIATTLDIPVGNTKVGSLAPVVPEKFGALDLIIFGHELVSSDYQHAYRRLNFPRMVDQLHITTDNTDNLAYNVGGLQLLSLQDNGGGEGAVFFMDPPAALISQASQYYDHQPMTGSGDGKGRIRYDRLDDGRYILGIFLPYHATQSPAQ